jgi:hypothetical protein
MHVDFNGIYSRKMLRKFFPDIQLLTNAIYQQLTLISRLASMCHYNINQNTSASNAV